ncbi:MAG: hypothetical protein Q8R28_00690, partial [Dehalococcoidia bacterium]|nr:hypothetical protein [Dehalococcoidia bacterium]
HEGAGPFLGVTRGLPYFPLFPLLPREKRVRMTRVSMNGKIDSCLIIEGFGVAVKDASVKRGA